MALAGPRMDVPLMTLAEVTQILRSAGFLSAKEGDELIDCHLGQFCSPQRATPARVLESILDKLGMNEETEFAQSSKHKIKIAHTISLHLTEKRRFLTMIRIEGKPNSTAMAKSVGYTMNEGPYSALTTFMMKSCHGEKKTEVGFLSIFTYNCIY